MCRASSFSFSPDYSPPILVFCFNRDLLPDLDETSERHRPIFPDMDDMAVALSADVDTPPDSIYRSTLIFGTLERALSYAMPTRSFLHSVDIILTAMHRVIVLKVMRSFCRNLLSSFSAAQVKLPVCAFAIVLPSDTHDI